MSSKEQPCARNPANGVLSQHWHSPTALAHSHRKVPPRRTPTLASRAMEEIGEKQKLLQHHDATLHDIAVIAHLSHHRNGRTLCSVYQGRAYNTAIALELSHRAEAFHPLWRSHTHRSSHSAAVPLSSCTDQNFQGLRDQSRPSKGGPISKSMNGTLKPNRASPIIAIATPCPFRYQDD